MNNILARTIENHLPEIILSIISQHNAREKRCTQNLTKINIFFVQVEPRHPELQSMPNSMPIV